MKEALTIVLFDGSLKTTPFINRLAKGLAKRHRVYIIGFNASLKYPLKGVQYMALGSSEKSLSLFLVSIKLALQLLLKNYNLRRFFKTFKHIATNDKTVLKQSNFNIALELISPDILHIQWPSLLPWCGQVIENPKIKTILSQRGFQNNVRPLVDADNFEYLRKVYPKIDGFHSVSKAITETGDKIYPSKNKIDFVVYSGFDFHQLKFNTDYPTSISLSILSVGRPHWVKGYEYALQACKILKEADIDFQYSIVGAKMNEELQFMINDLKLGSHVKLLERISQKEVYNQMRNSSLLLMPSVIEGLPNIIIEAMALGLPVISSECGGVEELIINNETGWLVPRRNPRAMADAIFGFTKLSLENIETVRISARKKVELQHNEAQMIIGMDTLYREVLLKME